ncbi:MAG: ABC transporter ATP-binding protein [Rhodobacteraceae bacterium]|nr:ABC transporter ATP-binding protein [Paracoccaceae bacterium]
MLTLEDVEVWRGPSQVLRGVTLAVREGEIVALLGANGAGKTSTLLTISGHLRPRAGRIKLAAQGREHDLASIATAAIVGLGVAHCPEGRQVFGAMTVEENLRLGAYLRRDGLREDIAAMAELFPVLGERRRELAGRLSGGEQMMLAIARALMSRPRLLLLDEPSLGLAPQMVERIFEVIADIRARGATVLLVEQNAAMALDVADRAYVIEAGAVAIEGAAAALADDPRVREAYLGLGEAAA